MKLKPEAGAVSGISFAGGVAYIKLKPLGAAEVGYGSSVDASAAGYMKPKTEVAVEVGSSY